ncbi:MAG: TlpA disulfide reductase family protein [Planctomycetota bacterium]|nr:TlpA disulfide reductase family protein [Planctomycetota bacterium]
MGAQQRGPAGGADSPALEWSVEQWFNHTGDLQLSDLRGRVVALECFQMLCPGCVSHGLPQAQRIRAEFPASEVAVLGMHTVFEHHEAMRPVALEAFLHEYRVGFPVGVDRPTADRLPETMARFELRGTPSLLLFDRGGKLREHHFGVVSDMRIGAEISALLTE